MLYKRVPFSFSQFSPTNLFISVVLYVRRLTFTETIQLVLELFLTVALAADLSNLSTSFPTLVLFGVPDPFSTPAAFANNCEAKGVFNLKVYVLSL